ncbi:MAG TPA: cardiolipin synthase [Gammaproteobacteria bacterium]|nr:cardiolipin synthase [Gammaproteobacteria bacterium]
MEIRWLDWIASPLLMHAASVVGVVLALVLVSRVLRSPREPAATAAWLAVIILLPLVGVPLYLMFGDRKLRQQLTRKRPIDLPDRERKLQHPVHDMLVSLGIPAASSGNQTKFHDSGEKAWEGLLELLETASSSIDIAIFILADDEVGRALLARLEGKAAEGVNVRLLLDGVGSFKLPSRRLQRLRQLGGRVAWFIPVLHRPMRGKTNLRNHRKIVIVDGQRVWSGGRNLGREYLAESCGEDCWIDLSFSQQGPCTVVYRSIFEADWAFAARESWPPVPALPEDTSNELGRIQVVPSGPDVAGDPLHAALLVACYEARYRICLVTPYFVPDRSLQEALQLAALRGVRVDMVLPERSNHRLADVARSRYLRELAAAGANIWLLPSAMVHAKALVIDKKLGLAGSANLDLRSLFLNFEVVSLFYSETEIRWLEQWMEDLIRQSRLSQPLAVGKGRELIEGIVELLAYQL